MLIHRAPQVMLLAVDFEEDFVQVPFVARLRAPPLERVRVSLAELATPLPDRFVADDDAAGREDLFDVAIARAGSESRATRHAQ